MVIGGRPVVARPVSVPVMLRVLAGWASREPAQMLEAEAMLLRAAFPRAAWWARWRRDPVDVVRALPTALRRAVLQRLTRVPADAAPTADGDDPLAATRAWQRAAVRPAQSHGPRPTLLLAAQACRAHFGHGWYYAPGEYQTADGYVPHDVAWLEYYGLQALDARAQLVQVQAHAVAHAGKDARRSLQALMRAAYPADPLLAPTAPLAATADGLVH